MENRNNKQNIAAPFELNQSTSYGGILFSFSAQKFQPGICTPCSPRDCPQRLDATASCYKVGISGAETDVAVRVGAGVVDVQGKHASIRAIVPVAAANRVLSGTRLGYRLVRHIPQNHHFERCCFIHPPSILPSSVVILAIIS